MKWLLYWAIAATANEYSQPVVSFDTKAHCQRYAQQFHKNLDKDMMSLAVGAMLARNLEGKEDDEAPETTAEAVEEIRVRTSFSMVESHRKFTLVCKQAEERGDSVTRGGKPEA